MRLGAVLKRGDVICLDGDLGAGKTTLVQGVAAGWGSTDAVSSPTFVLVNLYRRHDGQQFAHLDAYRLSGSPEAVDLDLDTLMENGPLVVEWAPRIEAALPEENLEIHMRWVEEEQRQLQFNAKGSRYQDLLNEFQNTMMGGD